MGQKFYIEDHFHREFKRYSLYFPSPYIFVLLLKCLKLFDFPFCSSMSCSVFLKVLGILSFLYPGVLKCHHDVVQCVSSLLLCMRETLSIWRFLFFGSRKCLISIMIFLSFVFCVLSFGSSYYFRCWAFYTDPLTFLAF